MKTSDSKIINVLDLLRESRCTKKGHEEWPITLYDYICLRCGALNANGRHSHPLEPEFYEAYRDEYNLPNPLKEEKK